MRDVDLRVETLNDVSLQYIPNNFFVKTFILKSCTRFVLSCKYKKFKHKYIVDSNNILLFSMMYGTRQYINSKSENNQQACYKKYKYNTIQNLKDT